MNNINFSNPWCLLVGLVLLIVVFVAFFLLIKKDGFNFHNIASLVIHAFIVIGVTIAMSGMTLELNITETDVYVLADCSYSSKRNLSVIDTKIKELSKNLPNNSKLGVIAYGKDYEVVSELGSKFNTVSETTVDDTQTNVRPALEYVSKKFNDDAIKRVVIITDGLETSSESISGIISNYEDMGIHIDAIFLDNTLKDDAYEYQVSSVKYNSTTYLNTLEEAVVTIESNQAVENVSVTIKDDTKTIDTQEISLVKGTNKVTFTLPTAIKGHKVYTVSVSDNNEMECDFNPNNNSYTFTQDVSDKIRVLFLSNDSDNGEAELESFKKVYSASNYEITSYVNDDLNVPTLLDDLCKYDEIVLDSFNVGADDFRDSATTFVTNLKLAVSEYGKTLHTFGNTSVQNSTGDDELKALGDMLPIGFGNNGETKSYTILIDISNSMLNTSHLAIAKEASIKLLNLLNETDYFTIIGFYGNNQIIAQGLATSTNILKAGQAIDELSGKQATNIEGALTYAYNLMAESTYKNKKVMLISDGLDHSNGSQSALADLKTKIKEQVDKNIYTDMIIVNENYVEGGANSSSDFDIANAIKACADSNHNGGNVTKITTVEEVNGAKFGEVTQIETAVERTSAGFPVTTKNKNSEVLAGNAVTQSVTKFYASNAKSSANTIVTVKDKNVDYPLYATWSFGEGSVTSFTSNIGQYSKSSGTNEYKFVSNIVPTYTPTNQTSAPYKMDVETEGGTVSVTLTSESVSPNASIYLSVRRGGDNVGQFKFSANTSNYFTSFEISEVGTYKLTMEYNNVSITKYYTLSYYEEYDAFQISDSSFLYSLVTSDGQVIEDGNLVINNDNLDVTKYRYTFAPLMMILSIILFVCDVAIRKLKWQDIKSLFKKGKMVK